MFHRKRNVFYASLLSLFLLNACSDDSAPPAASKATANKEEVKAELVAAPSFPCLNAPTINSTVPGDSPITDQASLDCFAWQEFIALNWSSSSGAGAKDFGKPGDMTPTVWETYMDIHQLMTPDGSTPPAWGTPPVIPDACKGKSHDLTAPLLRTSKFSVDFDAPSDADEAFPEKGQPAWLADKEGNLVWYEILVNKDEYDYVTDLNNRYYNAKDQYDKLSAGQHLAMPKGDTAGTVGAIELKAAWLTVPDPSDSKWNKYKLSKGLAYDAVDDTCEEITVALVGLHIIHKTVSQPQWIWATFEHVDNAPDQKDVDAGTVNKDYTFYSQSCEAKPISATCQNLTVGICKSTGASTTTCEPNTPPAYCMDINNSECPPYPIQTTRLYPIPNSGDNLVQQLNAAVSQLIQQQARSDSVWQNYQLVNVLWSDSPVDDNGPGTKPPIVPLSTSGLRPNPDAQPVSNTTMETYIQTATCQDCHHDAKIAWPTQDKTLTQFASDYSFIFKNAKPAPSK